MPDPLDTNDDWAELARELERDKPPAPPADMVERRVVEEEVVEPHHGTDPRLEDAAVAEGEPEAAAEDEFDESEEGEPAEAGAEGAEGQPGTGRKRRRRRRRRRKGGGAPEGAAALAGDDVPAEIAEPAEEEVEAPVAEEFAEAEEFGTADAETESVSFGVEEDTASEALRDLIANWNVPSWDEIVGGLYRPH